MMTRRDLADQGPQMGAQLIIAKQILASTRRLDLEVCKVTRSLRMDAAQRVQQQHASDLCIGFDEPTTLLPLGPLCQSVAPLWRGLDCREAAGERRERIGGVMQEDGSTKNENFKRRQCEFLTSQLICTRPQSLEMPVIVQSELGEVTLDLSRQFDRVVPELTIAGTQLLSLGGRCTCADVTLP
ncbi:hypothetical protein LH128_22427 [Sphingomonas sp. LH128]|nr:hypothetical protein LH128_22427 [Sphingomonas sp. LH128]